MPKTHKNKFNLVYLWEHFLRFCQNQKKRQLVYQEIHIHRKSSFFLCFLALALCLGIQAEPQRDSSFLPIAWAAHAHGSHLESYGFLKKDNELYFAFNPNMPLTGITIVGDNRLQENFVLNFGNFQPIETQNLHLDVFVPVQVKGLYSDAIAETLLSKYLAWSTREDYWNVLGTDGALGGLAYQLGYFDLNTPFPGFVQKQKWLTRITQRNISLFSTSNIIWDQPPSI